MTREHRRGVTLLTIVQAWTVPCHGFTYAPCGRGCSGSAACPAGSLPYTPAAARQSYFSAPKPFLFAAETTVSGRNLPVLRMSDEGGAPDPFGDELPGPGSGAGSGIPLEPPGPYRDEHSAGGSRFKELLARANGQAPPRPPPVPRRAPPPGGAPNYDDDSLWEEEREAGAQQRIIGSPDVPDPPLRQEMPGLDLGPELGSSLPTMGEPGGGGSGGGSRFSRMMNQARQNDDRQEAGMAPRASPRSPQEVAKRAAQQQQSGEPVSKEERDRAIKAAVERQQKLMAKARGIDLDDPTLDGAELARKKALSRAQAESQAGGYVPSSSAADDYLNALKVDSQRKQAEIQARLQGKPLPPREEPLLSALGPLDAAADDPQQPPSPPPMSERFERPKPQKRTAATWSIQNKADAYMASLKGIKVDIAENPYLKQEADSLKELRPRQIVRPPPPPPEPPLGPQMTYAERLRLAKQAKAAVGSPGAPAAAAAAATAVAQAVAPALASRPDAAAPQVPPPTPSPAVGAPAARIPAQRSMLDQEAPENALLGEDGAQAKIMKVMDLLTEHKTTGLVGEERVSELRRSLVDAREILRAETYGSSGDAGAAAPPVAPPPPPLPRPQTPSPQQMQQMQQQQQQQQQQTTAPRRPPAPPAAPLATNQEDAETLRRCSALLQAHVHSSLAGEDLQALVEGLASSLTIVTAEVVAGIAAADGGGDGGSPKLGAVPPPVDPTAGGEAPVPSYVGGVQSVGGVLSDMGVGKKPASFVPETREEGDRGDRGWTGGSLGEEDKAIASKALGYLLKHRGGKGYGRGRVTGAEAEAMVAALAEVTEIMQEEMVEE